MLALNKIYFIDLFYKETRTKISTKYKDIKRKGALILQELLQRESLTKQKSISTFFSLALLLLLLRSTWESPAAGSASVGVLIWLGLALIHLQRELKAHRVGRDLGQEVEQVEVKGNLLKTKDKVKAFLLNAKVKASLLKTPTCLVKGYLLTQLLRSFKEQGRRPHFFTTVSLPWAEHWINQRLIFKSVVTTCISYFALQLYVVWCILG